MSDEVQTREFRAIAEAPHSAAEQLGMVLAEALPLVAGQLLEIARKASPVNKDGSWNKEDLEVVFKLNSAMIGYINQLARLSRANKRKPEKYAKLDQKKLDERFKQIDEALAQRQQDIDEAAEARKKAGFKTPWERKKEEMSAHLSRSRKYSQTAADIEDDE